MHYFSDRCAPFKTVLPQLIAGASQEQERVLVIESPLRELIDETIRVYRGPDWVDQVVVDERPRAFFEAVTQSLAEAMAKIEQIAGHKIRTAALLVNRHGKRLTAPTLRSQFEEARTAAAEAAPVLADEIKKIWFTTCARRLLTIRLTDWERKPRAISWAMKTSERRDVTTFEGEKS